MPVTVLRVPFLADLPGSSRIIEHWEHFPSGINVGIIFYKFHQHPVNKDRNGKYPNRTCVFLFSFQSPWWINGLCSKIIRCKISSTQEDMQPKRKKNPVQIFHFSLILQLFSSYGYNSGSEKDVRSAWGTQCWKLLHFDYSRCRCESVTWIVTWLQKLLCLIACGTAQGCLCIFGCPQGHWVCLLFISSLSSTTSHNLHPHDRT